MDGTLGVRPEPVHAAGLVRQSVVGPEWAGRRERAGAACEAIPGHGTVSGPDQERKDCATLVRGNPA